jgi:light-regulated signal transduction histidine kinase (bacteriophytochrome)
MTSSEFGSLDLVSCDNEPIHIPGAIQPNGVLLALAAGTLPIEQVAGDTKRLLGARPEDLLGQPIEAWFGAEQVARLHDALQTQRQLTRLLPMFETVTLQGGGRMDATVHDSGGVVVLELEACGAAGRDTTLAVLRTMQQHIQGAHTAPDMCRGIAQAVRVATGFDRVMVYRFLPDGTGMVDAEARDAGMEPFLGLHYPASDIPARPGRCICVTGCG